MRTAALLVPVLLLMACAGPRGGGRPSDGDLFRGDRVNIDREFIYLDDPLFLQAKSVYGHRIAGGPGGPAYFSFRIPIYFNAGPKDTLRFGPGGMAVLQGPGDSAAGPVSCMVDTGDVMTDPAAIAERFRDTDRTLVLAPRREGSAKVNLVFHCSGYDPPLGRMDTLSLAFRKKTGAEGFKEVAFPLPYHVSYRGPVVSVLIGLGLLYAFTQAGWWIAEM
jgi:hypothetical protein